MVTSSTEVPLAFSFCIKTEWLPCSSASTLIPPLRVVCLESPPSQGLPNFGNRRGVDLAHDLVRSRNSHQASTSILFTALRKYDSLHLDSVEKHRTEVLGVLLGRKDKVCELAVLVSDRHTWALFGH